MNIACTHALTCEYHHKQVPTLHCRLPEAYAGQRGEGDRLGSSIAGVFLEGADKYDLVIRSATQSFWEESIQ